MANFTKHARGCRSRSVMSPVQGIHLSRMRVNPTCSFLCVDSCSFIFPPTVAYPEFCGIQASVQVYDVLFTVHTIVMPQTNVTSAVHEVSQFGFEVVSLNSGHTVGDDAR